MEAGLYGRGFIPLVCVIFANLTGQRWGKSRVPCGNRRFSEALVALMCVYSYLCCKFSF